jgi:2-polyprenyl-6-methoxyphenol hydroxylase-like FAD-dependent oxidoreductase
MEIVVIGAGLSGLALAAAMRRKAPEVRVTIRERDPSAFSRPQGYAIGIKGGTGLPALRDLGVDVRVFTGDTVKVNDFVFTDQRGRCMLALRPSERDERNLTVRVQRRQLEAALLEAVGGSAEVRYGHGFTKFEADGDGITAVLDDQQRIRADYLVGCDGVASAVRAQLVGDAPRFLCLTAIDGDAPPRRWPSGSTPSWCAAPARPCSNRAGGRGGSTPPARSLRRCATAGSAWATR